MTGVCVCVHPDSKLKALARHVLCEIVETAAGAPGMCGLAWCNEAPVTHQDMVGGHLDRVPALCL